jgi:hypothetical protein
MEEVVYIYEEWLRIYGISIRGQPIRGGPPAWGFGDALLTTLHPLPEKRAEDR